MRIVLLCVAHVWTGVWLGIHLRGVFLHAFYFAQDENKNCNYRNPLGVPRTKEGR